MDGQLSTNHKLDRAQTCGKDWKSLRIYQGEVRNWLAQNLFL